MKSKRSLISTAIIVLFALIYFCASGVRVARGASFTSYQSGNWNDQCTWSATCNGGLPASGDSVIISSGHTVTVTNSNPVNIGGGAITNNGSLVLNDALTSGDLSLVGASSSLTTNDKAVSVGSLTNAGTITAGASTLSVSGNYANSGTFNAGTSTITMTATSTGKTFTAGGQTYNNINFNGTGGDWSLIDDLVTNSTGTITFTKGTLHTDGVSDNSNLTHNWSKFVGASGAKILYLGNSNITISGTGTSWEYLIASSSINAGTSTLIFTGTGANFNSGGGTIYYDVRMIGAGSQSVGNGTTFTNFSRIGTNSRTDSLINYNGFNVNGVLTLAGNSVMNRLAVYSGTLGTARTITLGASATFKSNSSNVDFQDITVTGGAAGERDLSSILGGSGDCGGNTGITFTPSTKQNWINPNGGGWYVATNWSSRIPLPQDDVTFNTVFGTSKTIIAGMPRLGRDIDFSGATYTTSLTLDRGTMDCTLYGSLKMHPTMTYQANSGRWNYAGRGSHTITSSGNSINSGWGTTLSSPGGTYTLVDDYNASTTNFGLAAGTFDSAGHNVQLYAVSITTANNLPRIIQTHGSIWTLSSSGNVWYDNGALQFQLDTTGGFTLNLTNASASATSFYGGTSTFGDIVITPGGSGVLTFIGNFTFANMRLSTAGAKTIKFTSGSTYTITGNDFFSGNTSRPTINTIMSGNTLNGDFETLGGGGADVFGSWTENINLTGVISEEVVDVHGGSRSAKMTTGAESGYTALQQNCLTVGKLYKLTYWAKANTNYALTIGDTTSQTDQALTSTWTQYTKIWYAASTNLFMKRSSSAADNKTIYLDDFQLIEYSGAIVTPSTIGSPFTLSKTSGVLDVNNIYLQGSTATGGAVFNAHYSIDGGDNSGWGFPTYKIVSDVGGNWDSSTTWVEGSVPLTTDEIGFTSTSGNLTVNVSSTCAGLNTLGYTNTVTAGAVLTVTNNFTLNGGTFNAASYNMNVGGSFARTSGTFTAGTGTITMNATSTGKTFTSGGQTYNNITFDGVGGGWSLLDGITVGDALTLTNGTLHTDGVNDNSSLTHNWTRFTTGYSGSKVLLLGNSTITVTYNGGGYAWTLSHTVTTLNAGTSKLIFTGANTQFIGGVVNYYEVRFMGAGSMMFSGQSTYTNLIINGSVTQTYTASLGSDQIVNGLLSVNGNSVINRVLLKSNTIGTARAITLGASATFKTNSSNVDFQDITVTGGAAGERDLSNISGGSGDCGGNTGITFTTAVTQTWNGASGNWSTASMWTSRVPLPQDNVIIPNPGATPRSLTANMPRLGKDITVTNDSAANRPTINFNNQANTLYGSLTFVTSTYMTFISTKDLTFGGRSNSTWTSAGQTFGANGISLSFTIAMPGATMTLQDDLLISIYGGLRLNNGTLTTTHNVSADSYTANVGTTTNMGNGTWTMVGGGVLWNSDGTINAGSSTISCTFPTNNTTFQGGNSTYNNIQFAPGTGTTTVYDGFTFANMTMASVGAKTIKFVSGYTYTMTGTNFLSGTSGNLVTISSNTYGSPATISKVSGTIDTNWNVIQDITFFGGGTWNAHYSTNVFGNTGINFPTYKIVSDAGGNWDAVGSWDGGVTPAATDDIGFKPSSGALTVNVESTCAYVYTGGYASTMTLGARLYVNGNFYLADGTVNGGNYNLSILGDYARTAGTFSPGTGTIVMTATTTGHTFRAGGQTYYNVNFNGAGGEWTLQDELNCSGDLNITRGTFNTNSNNIRCRSFNPANTSVNNLGTSVITCTWSNNWALNLSVPTIANTDYEFILSGAGAYLSSPSSVTLNKVTFTGGGNMYIETTSRIKYLTITGTNEKTGQLRLGDNITIDNQLSVNGNSSINRLLLRSNTIGSAHTIILGAPATFKNNSSNVDFQDITVTGGAAGERDLSNISGGSGDCGGNTGITFTQASTQTFTNAAGGNWSVVSNWTSRVPLPQDDVKMNRGGNYNSNITIEADMPRLGKNIDWTGVTYTAPTKPTFTMYTLNVNLYGSLTMIPSSQMGYSSTKTLTFGGRSNSSLTSAGQTFPGSVAVAMPGSTLTLEDNFSGNSSLSLTYGTLTATNNISVYNYAASANTTTNMGNGTWTLTAPSNGNNVWTAASGGTLNAGNSTIVITSANNGVNVNFLAGGYTYNNIVLTSGSGSSVTFSSSFTFANMTLATPGIKTVKFEKGKTFSMTGTNFLSGTSGSLVTISSDTPGTPATISKPSGTVDMNWASIQDITATGGAIWNAHYSTNISGNTGINFPAFKTISNAGGNWSAGTAWAQGSAPTGSDEVVATTTSGNLTLDTTGLLKRLDLSLYSGTFTHGDHALNFGTLASNNDFILSAAMTYTDTGSGSIWFNASSGVSNITSAGKNLPTIYINNSGETVRLVDTLNMVSTKGVNLNLGTFDTNNQILNIGSFTSTPTNNTRVLNLGSSTVNLSLSNGVAWSVSTAGEKLTVSPGTSQIILSGANATFQGAGLTYNTVQFTGITNGGQTGPAILDSNTFANLIRTGTAAMTDYFRLDANQTVTNSLQINGNSSINRVLMLSNTAGVPRTVNLSSFAKFKTGSSNADFQDIAISGGSAEERDLSAIPGLSGDCGGNSGITLTPSATQTFTNINGGYWSDSANWTSRVPLPQDNVILNRGGNYNSGAPIWMNMFRSGHDIDCTGMTWTGTATKLYFNQSVTTIYGSLTLITGVLGTHSQPLTFAGRGNTTITMAGNAFNTAVGITKPGATLTFLDNFSSGVGALTIWKGTLTTNSNVTAGSFYQYGGTTLNMGNGNWTITSSGGQMWGALGTVNKGNSTIYLTDTSGTGKTFAGSTNVFNDIIITPGGAGALTLSGAFTFNNMTMASPGTKTIKFTKNTTYTMTGSNFLTGNGANIITVSSDTGGTPFTITKSSGVVSSDYLSIQDSTATGGAEWFAGANSVNVSGNDSKGWIFSAPTAQNRYWVSSSSNDWDSSANWSNTSNGTTGYSIPTSLDTAIFDGAGGKNADLNLSGPLSVGTLDLRSTYTGTLRQNAQTIHTESSFIIDNADLSPTATISSSGTLTIGTSKTLNLDGHDLLVDGTLSSSGTLKLQGDENVSLGANDSDSGTVEYKATAGNRNLKNWTYYNLTLDGFGGTFTLPASLAVNGNLLINNGTLNDGGYDLSVGGNWTKISGGFNATSGTVTFNATTTGKTIRSGGSAFGHIVFNGVGGGWTLQDDIFTQSITLTNGNLIDNGKTVTVNGDMIVGSTAGLLTSSGRWVQAASGNLANISPSNQFKSLSLAGTGVTTTLTGNVYIGFGYVNFGSGTLNGQNYYMAMYPSVNDALTISDLVMGTALQSFWYVPTANVSQKEINLPVGFAERFYLRNANYSLTATGNFNFGSCPLQIDSNTTGVPSKFTNMSAYNLTSGNLSLGYANFTGYLKLGSGTHNIGGLTRLAGETTTSHILDLGSSTVNTTGNINLTGFVVNPGSSTINMTSTTAGKTITSAGQSFNNLTFNGIGGAWTLADDLDVNADLKLQNGTLTTNNRNINVGRDWNRAGGTYTGGTTKVTLDSGQFGHVYGDTSFYDLVLDTSGATTNTAKAVNFASNSTQTITHALTLSGAVNKPLTIGREGGSGSDHWFLTLPSNYTAGPYIWVNSSQINAPYTVTPNATTTNLGNNIGWNFPIAADRTTHVLPGGTVHIEGRVQIK